MVRNQIKILLCALFCFLFAGAAWADGAVYAMTNALDNNEILVYTRAADGALSLVQTIATGGGGSGLQLTGLDALGSAGSLQLDEGHKLLFAVNTESAAENNGSGAYNTDCKQGTITSFVVAADGTLTFADRVFSGGLFPNSLTVQSAKKGADLLYVLNAGGPEAPAICNNQPDTANTPNITGFVVDSAGHMNPVGSTQPIDPGPATGPAGGVVCTAAAAAGFSGLTGAPAADFQCGLNPPSFPRSPAQVLFSPDGNQLVVTVKGTNVIYVFPINKDGTAGDATVILNSPGPALPTPMGVTFDNNGNLLVVELFGTATSIPAGSAGAVSSYNLTKTPSLILISSSVGDGGTAPCCIALEPINGLFAYVANNLSASISSYTVGSNGAVTLLNGTAATGSGPNDLATAVEGKKKGATSFLYVLDAGTGTVGAFKINGDGSLTAITGGGGLPAGRSAQGLAAY
jgi:6-phosphogluconolactonase (cycloisomerase 2 family)